MNIFIDTISKIGTIILFDEKRKIIDNINLDFKKNESSKLIPTISKILEKNNLDFKKIENIIVVNGPGSFTGIRSTILTINSINFIIKKNITTLNFFDLFDKYPIVKASSKRDIFLKIDKNSEIKIFDNKEFDLLIKKNNIKTIYGDIDKNIFENIKIKDTPEYKKIIENIKIDNLKIAEANYIKKPSIN